LAILKSSKHVASFRLNQILVIILQFCTNADRESRVAPCKLVKSEFQGLGNIKTITGSQGLERGSSGHA
jgi:hypothetical protein